MAKAIKTESLVAKAAKKEERKRKKEKKKKKKKNTDTQKAYREPKSSEALMLSRQ